MANIEEFQTEQSGGDQATPTLASQDKFNKFIDKHVEHLFDGDNAYNHPDVAVMSRYEREIRRSGHSLPSYQEELSSDRYLEQPSAAEGTDPIREKFELPAISLTERNAGRRKTDVAQLGKLAFLEEKDRA